MRDEKISDFLARLADRVPAPGGGAAAALHAAQAAALLGMVARYPIRPTVPFISTIRDQHHNPRPAMAQLVNATHIIPKNRPWSKLSGSRKTSTPVDSSARGSHRASLTSSAIDGILERRIQLILRGDAQW